MREPSQEVRRRPTQPQRQQVRRYPQHLLAHGRNRSPNRGWELRQVSPGVSVQIEIIFVLLVSAEQLVRSFANLNHLCSGLTGELRHIIKRDADRIRDWLVLMKD